MQHTRAAAVRDVARHDRAVTVPLADLARDADVRALREVLDPAIQQELLDGLREGRARELVEALDPDDRARLLDEMPAMVAQRLPAGLSPAERAATAALLGYPEGSGGRMMSPEVAHLRASLAAAEALERVRALGRQAETVYALPVTDDERRLLGVVELRDLVLAEPDARIVDLMGPEVHRAAAADDQEYAARLIQEADLVALPVIDGEERLVGIITVDDAMAVLGREASEDIARGAGTEPLDRRYLSSSILFLAGSRAIWLLALILAATVTVNVLDAFEGTLAEVVTLALFIPLLIGTGGNAGAQSATTVVRAMAVGEVRFSDLGRVVLREVRVGMMLGAIIAAVGFGSAALFAGTDIATALCLSLFLVVTWATLAGSPLPLPARRAGLDPAVVSAPLITTLVDATGLVIYFLVARAVLGI